MDRLTSKNKGQYERKTTGVTNSQLINKLGRYEDLEEQGKLLELPVAKGDKVYCISDYGIEEWEVVEVSDSRIWVDSTYIDYDDLGNTVFLTEEAAEAELEKKTKWAEHLSRRFCQVE